MRSFISRRKGETLALGKASYSLAVQEGCKMLKMEGSRVKMTPENVHKMLKEGLSFKEIAARCDVFEDAIDAALVRWLNQGRWPVEDDVAA